MNKAHCKGCGAPIIWIPTKGGKSMPCDPAPIYYREKEGAKTKLVTSRGEVVSCEVVAATEAEGAGYAPHWGTCPEAGAFKGGGGANGKR